MSRTLSTKAYLALVLGLLFVILSVIVVVLVNMTMRRLALTDAEHDARMLLDHNLAISSYFSQDLKPKLFERLGPTSSKDYFEPVWMSSTYAKRKIDGYFRHFNKSPYYYKECAINARSPENEADDYEKAFLVDLQNSPRLTTKSAIRVLDGKPYFTLLRRGEAMEESCLRCHSSPEQAPGDLVRHYGPERSFHRKVQDVVQAISIRIPLSEGFSSATRFSYYLSGLLLLTFGGGFLFVWVGNKRLIISPMANIQEQALHIASEQEHLGETIPEPKLRELRDLVVAFNQMSVALRKTYDELEQRVLERTKELAMERERLSVTLRSIGDGVISTDTLGKVVSVNQTAETLTGWVENEAAGRPLEEVFHIINQETRQRCENPVQKVLQQGQIVGLANHTVLIGRDGKERVLADSGAPIRAESGEILGVVLVFRDVTERARVSEELHKQEEMMRAVLATSPVGIVLTQDRKIKWANNSWIKMFGFTSADEYHDQPTSVMHSSQEIYERVRKILYEHIEYGQISEADSSFRRKDGTLFDVHIRTSLLDASDPSGGTISAITDITRRKKSEEALRNSEQKYRNLFEDSVDALFITATDGTLLDANQAYFDLLGGEKVERLGHSVLKAYADPADRPPYFEALAAKGFVRDYPLKLVGNDGRQIDCLISSRVERDKDGNILSTRGFIRDITEQKNIQRQLLQAQKMEAIGTLSGGIAHDFNNLLTVVMGFSELLLAEKDQKHPDYADLQKIFHAAKNGADLVQRLLMFSRKSEPKPVPMDLNKQILQIEKMLRRTIPKMIEVRLDLSSDLPRINADPSQVEQVIMNLAVNARDAMPDKGKLTLRTNIVTLDEDYCRLHVEANPGEYVLLEISDTGRGMDKETCVRIFEPFFTTKEIGKGTGLGLAMVFGIVKQHKGHITVYSEVGKGTTFRVYLPAIEGEVETAVEDSGIMPAFGTETVLLVDDEQFVRELGARILTKHGYTVLQAVNGREALDLFGKERSQISLVILDLIMPEMGGTECLKELLKIDPQVNVLVASGYSADASVKGTIQMGAKGFVTKPFRVKDLLRDVRRVLDEK